MSRECASSGLLGALALGAAFCFNSISAPSRSADEQALACGKPIQLTIAEDEKQRIEDIKEACLRIYPSWRKRDDIPKADVKVSVVSGGITNELFRAEYEGESVLFRLYGAKTDLIIDREKENFVFAELTRRGFGPKLYGRCLNGRAEEWLIGNHLNPQQMVDPSISQGIGDRLAEMHQLDMPLERSSELWQTLDDWIGIAESVSFSDAKKQAVYDALPLDDIKRDIGVLREKLPGCGSPVVFCHNDLLGGNVIYNKADKSVMFIDFEYGGYNYRGFDIANHFCECCGFDCDWSLFPRLDAQRPFLRGYLSRALGKPAAEVSEEEILALHEEAQQWVPCSHLYWGVWAVVQARHSPIDFDFIGYAKQRLDGYQQMRGFSRVL